MKGRPLVFDWDTGDMDELRANTKALIHLLKYCERDTNGLLYWRGYRMPNGYGQISHQNKLILAHRMAYALLVDMVPSGMNVLHHNDDPSCVDPSMLYLGSARQNTRDMLARGRGVSPPGEGNGKSKLTEAQVWDIRFKCRPGRGNHPNIKDLAQEYRMDAGNISRIVNRKTWKHI